MSFSSNPRTGDPEAGLRIKRCSLVTAGLAVVLLSLALGLVFTGCGEEGLVGTWTSAEQGETLEFRLDGTAILTMRSRVMATLLYEAKGSSLIFGAAGTATRTVGYSIKGGVLTLTFPGEDPARYVRVSFEDG